MTKLARKITHLVRFLLILFCVLEISGKNSIFLDALSISIGLFFVILLFDLEKYTSYFRNSYNISDFQLLPSVGKNKETKICSYILNLDRATERLSYVLPRVKNLAIPFERISAVEGKNLQQKEIDSIVDIESYKKFFKMLPEAGTIGCSLSHEKAWRKFLESDNEFAIVFEDDVFFDEKQLLEVINELIQKKNLWDLLSFEVNHHGCPLKIAKLNDSFSMVAYITNVRHSGAYMINRKAAYRLLQKFYPIKMPIDHYFQHSWEFDLKSCGIEPRIVHQKFGDSQIKISSRKKINTINILFFNAIFNINIAIMHAVYNLCCWFICVIKNSNMLNIGQKTKNPSK